MWTCALFCGLFAGDLLGSVIKYAYFGFIVAGLLCATFADASDSLFAVGGILLGAAGRSGIMLAFGHWWESMAGWKSMSQYNIVLSLFAVLVFFACSPCETKTTHTRCHVGLAYSFFTYLLVYFFFQVVFAGGRSVEASAREMKISMIVFSIYLILVILVVLLEN